MKKVKSQAGFSLIELMMVVVIIGVLAGVGIPQYQKFQMKARQSEVKSLLSGMYTAQKAFYAEWTQYYSDFNAVGFGLSGDLGYNVGFSGNVSGPNTHPRLVYRGNGLVRNSLQYCAANGCTITKARVTNIPGSLITVTTFNFAGRANLDEDGTTDDWNIDEDKVYTQTSDDIAG
jgi:type IV pilus assembly protein PilA